MGEVLEGFKALSDEDKIVFLQCIGGMGYQPAAVTAAAAKSVSTAQSAQTPLPVGYTRHPGTGNIYRVQPPKERPSELLELQKEYEEARVELALGMKAKDLYFDPDSKKTLDTNGKPVELPMELEVLKERTLTCKQQVKDFKKVHPEMFSPPPKRGGGRGRGLPRVPVKHMASPPQTEGKGRGTPSNPPITGGDPKGSTSK